VPGFAGQQVSTPPVPGDLSAFQLVSLATDGEEMDWLKKRYMREWFAVAHGRRTHTKKLKC
jgi:hypothetical protein